MHRPASCTALNTKLEQWRQPCGDVEEGHLAPPEAGQPCTRRLVPEDAPHQQPAVDASQAASSCRPAVSGRQGHAPGSAGRDAGWRRGCCWRRIPSTGTLCRLLAIMVGLVVAFHAASCGYFFCVRFPGVLEFPGSIYEDITDIYHLPGGPRVLASQKGNKATEQQHNPKLIPEIIHQTFKDSNLPSAVHPMMQSWRKFNPGWEIRFYDDAACNEFVQREFPEYMDAYKSLPKNVERADFFRYMVILKYGGVYSDIDTECRRPLSSIIKARDTMVVGWENEFATPGIAADRNYARTRQVLQWVFAAAPGHPALRDLCDHIALHAFGEFSGNTNRDTLERTGPGVWTDIILKHAYMHPPAKRDDPWNVRILPRVHFGAHPVGLDHIEPDSPQISVLHHYLGSWKVRGGWAKASAKFDLWRVWKLVKGKMYPQGGAATPPSIDEPVEFVAQVATRQGLYPVSMEWDPPFTMMVDLIGHGDLQAGADVSAFLSAWGAWQPALDPFRSPSVADALIGSLGGHGSERRVLLDIGAGMGMFSLAAAARGHKAYAFELSPKSLASLEASIEFNGFQHLITVQKTALGSADEEICVERGGAPAPPQFSSHNPSWLVTDPSHELDLARGYGHPNLHALQSDLSATAPAAAPTSAVQPGTGLDRRWAGSNCTRTARRAVATVAVPEGVEIGAVRISASGWEGAIVQGLKGAIEAAPPGVIMLELYPHSMPGGPAKAALLLRQLHSMGYTDMSHSGAVCDERWHNITRNLRLRGAMTLANQDFLQRQPTWCTLQPDKFESLAQRGHQRYPENVLLTYKTAAAEAGAPSPKGQAPRGAMGGPQAEEASAPWQQLPQAAAEDKEIDMQSQHQAPSSGNSSRDGSHHRRRRGSRILREAT